MKTTLFMAVVVLMPYLASAETGVPPGQALVESEVFSEKVPDEVIASAVQAVDELGKSVVQGRYEVALERMNPKEKENLAKQLGGLEAVEKQLKSVPAAMVEKGVRILSCKPEGQPKAYGIEPKMVKVQAAGGGGAQPGQMRYSQWLVLVPTVTKFRVWHRPADRPAEELEIESLSFQVAVSDRDKLDWTFIDGAGLTIGRLRNLYATLPVDIQLPEVHKRQVQK